MKLHAPMEKQQVAVASHRVCEAVLNSYHDHFHHQLLVIHLSTALSDTTLMPLVMAILCIGSLHRLDRRFHEAALGLIEKASR